MTKRDGLIPRGLKSRSEYKRVTFQKLGRFPTQEEWEEYCESAAEHNEGPPDLERKPLKLWRR